MLTLGVTGEATETLLHAVNTGRHGALTDKANPQVWQLVNIFKTNIHFADIHIHFADKSKI